jgi:hypothetical protein
MRLTTSMIGKDYLRCMKLMMIALLMAVLCHFAQGQNPDAASPCPITYIMADTMPEYPGGEDAMMEFIAKHLRYPSKLKKSRPAGVAHVHFAVGTDGSVHDVRMAANSYAYTESADVSQTPVDSLTASLLDAEAMRVVGLLKGFRPGVFNGKAVCVGLGVAVTFSLEKK